MLYLPIMGMLLATIFGLPLPKPSDHAVAGLVGAGVGVILANAFKPYLPVYSGMYGGGPYGGMYGGVPYGGMYGGFW